MFELSEVDKKSLVKSMYVNMREKDNPSMQDILFLYQAIMETDEEVIAEIIKELAEEGYNDYDLFTKIFHLIDNKKALKKVPISEAHAVSVLACIGSFQKNICAYN